MNEICIQQNMVVTCFRFDAQVEINYVIFSVFGILKIIQSGWFRLSYLKIKINMVDVWGHSVVSRPNWLVRLNSNRKKATELCLIIANRGPQQRLHSDAACDRQYLVWWKLWLLPFADILCLTLYVLWLLQLILTRWLWLGPYHHYQLHYWLRQN